MDLLLNTIFDLILSHPRQVMWWLLALAFFWVFYAFLMRVKRYRDVNFYKDEWEYWLITIVVGPLFIPGLLYDVAFNLAYGTVMFLQPPRVRFHSRDSFWETLRNFEWTFTARLQRLIHDEGWRGAEARFLCRNFVEREDQNHCGSMMLPAHLVKPPEFRRTHLAIGMAILIAFFWVLK